MDAVVAVRLVRVLLVSAALGVAALSASPVYGHAFGQRYDLPIPLNYFLIGAVATVALSFVVIGMFVRRRTASPAYPRLDLLRAPIVGTVISSRITSITIRTIAVAVFLLVVVAGFAGTNRPVENISPTFVWIIWWVGMGYVVALFGNVWTYLNPWKITFEWYRRLRRHSGEPEDPPFNYPDGFEVWPAVLLFFLFAWAENVFTGAFRPFTLSVMVLTYSAITWVGMAAFGKHAWLRNAEAFTVLFGIFAKFSPTEVRVTDRRLCRDCGSGCDEEAGCIDCYDCYERAPSESRELNIRPFAIGLALPSRITAGAAAFVILALSAVTFDGFQDTETWTDLRTGLLTTTTVDVVDTAALVAAPLIFAVVYLGFSWGVKLLSGGRTSVPVLARAFVFSLVPIALAYNLAHFITLLLIEGQNIIPLASDPLGSGWDLFGTADYRPQANIINAKVVWFISLIAIVLGHVTSVYLGHVVALARAPASSNVLREQTPMLALMVLYTASSLWIIAQPIVG